MKKKKQLRKRNIKTSKFPVWNREDIIKLQGELITLRDMTLSHIAEVKELKPDIISTDFSIRLLSNYEKILSNTAFDYMLKQLRKTEAIPN